MENCKKSTYRKRHATAIIPIDKIEDIAAIENIKSIFDEKTASKAILKAIRSFNELHKYKLNSIAINNLTTKILSK